MAETIVCGDTEVTLDQLEEYVSDILAVPLDQSEHTLIEIEFKVGVTVLPHVSLSAVSSRRGWLWTSQTPTDSHLLIRMSTRPRTDMSMFYPVSKSFGH